MGNKPRLTCAACGKIFKYRGAERCPGCTAPCERAAPAPAKRVKKLTSEARAVLTRLEECTILVDCFGATFDEAIRAVGAAPLLALDTEGVRLSRSGQLTLLQLGTADRLYLFDVLALGTAAFTAAPPGAASLRCILEDVAVTKLAWDVRRDSDALQHQHGVTLAGVVDVQLEAVAVRRASGAAVAALPGLAECLARWVDKASARASASLKQHIDMNDDSWARRPLTNTALRYAAADIMLTRALHEALAPHIARVGALDTVRRASNARLAEFRDQEAETPQERNALHRLAPDL